MLLSQFCRFIFPLRSGLSVRVFCFFLSLSLTLSPRLTHIPVLVQMWDSYVFQSLSSSSFLSFTSTTRAPLKNVVSSIWHLYVVSELLYHALHCVAIAFYACLLAILFSSSWYYLPASESQLIPSIFFSVVFKFLRWATGNVLCQAPVHNYTIVYCVPDAHNFWIQISNYSMQKRRKSQTKTVTYTFCIYRRKYFPVLSR